MHHFPLLQTTKINCIDLSEEWNLHPFLSPVPSSRLQKSIQSLGLLHPLILQKRIDNRYQLLCGRLRLRALQTGSRANNTVTALILENHTHAKRVLHYILEDQLLSGTLSPMEKAFFFTYCLKHMDLEETAKTFLPILDEKVQPHLVSRMLPLLDLEPEIQNSIHFGKIGEKVALELQQLTASDRLALYRIFQELELGSGKQKRLLALTKDLAFGQGKTIAALLAEPDSSTILDHPEMNPPQKATALLTTLQKKLFPESSAAEEEFQKAVDKMQLPAACSVTHSQAFERNEVYVTLCFNTLTEVENRLLEIKALAKEKE